MILLVLILQRGPVESIPLAVIYACYLLYVIQTYQYLILLAPKHFFYDM